MYTVSMSQTTTPRRGLTEGAEISVTGAPGRYTVRSIAPNGNVTCWGGKKGYERMRTFTADRIKTVHYRKPTEARPARVKRCTPHVDKSALAAGQAPRRNP